MPKRLVRICPSDGFCRVQNLPTSSVELIWPITELYFQHILATDFMNRFYLDVKTGSNVQSERLLQVSACAFLGRASTRMPTVHPSKFCFYIVAVCLWSRRPCHVHRERLPHMAVCVCTSWAKLDENADDMYFSSVFIHIVAYYRSVLFVVALSR